MRKQTGFALAVVVVVAAAVQGADFPPRTQLLEKSMRQGVGVAQVPLLRAAPGPGREKTLETLMNRLKSPIEKIDLTGKATTEKMKRDIVVTAPGWILEVGGNGRRARYRNFAYLDGTANARVAVSARPKQDELQVRARRFIGEQLRDFVKIGRGEEMVPLYTEYQISGGGSTASGAKPTEERVGAANVVFGRTIDGVHVIGPGSKVRVLFGSNGTIAGFDFDWPDYTRAQTVQRVVPLAEVRKRVGRLDNVDLEKNDVKVDHMECGYFDIGSDRRDPAAPLQSACAVFTEQKKIVDAAAYARNPGSGHITVAKLSIVPAGATVEADSRWPQALRFLGRKPAETPAPLTGPKRN